MKERTLKAALGLIAMAAVFWAAIPASTRLEGLEAIFGEALTNNGKLYPGSASGHEDVDSGDEVSPAETIINYYKTEERDSLWSIAGRNRITVEALATANNLADRDFIRAGQILKLPAGYKIHLVRSGENLESIASGYRVSISAIAGRNKLRDADKILAGECLLIPLFDTARARNYRDSRVMHLAWPVSGAVTSPYGMRDGQPHEGIDIAAEEGAPILAAGPGRVTFAGSRGTYGLAVIIDHGEGLSTLYAHCSRVIATEGNSVDAGTVIAEIGNTGRSRGPHLHLEVRSNGSPCDPMDYLPEKTGKELRAGGAV